MYPLWQVKVWRNGEYLLFLTRAKDVEQLKLYIKITYPKAGWEIHTIIPINGADRYAINHAPGWLDRPMHWLAC